MMAMSDDELNAIKQWMRDRVILVPPDYESMKEITQMATHERALIAEVDRLRALDTDNRAVGRFALHQKPDPDGALVRMDTTTGQTWRYLYGAWQPVVDAE